MKRQRGRNRRNNNQNNSNRSMESNGPEVKVRGTAKQIFDKYEALARDAASAGNRVKAENCRQHAEHYLRIVNAIEAAKQKTRSEAEAARGDSEDGKSEEGETESGRSRRRYPPQVRKSGDNEEVSSETTAEALEVVETEVQEEPVAAKKSTRRRKAPSRKTEDDPATEAAE